MLFVMVDVFYSMAAVAAIAILSHSLLSLLFFVLSEGQVGRGLAL